MNKINGNNFNSKSYDLIIVGAGLFGLTIANLAANELKLKCLIVEKRPNIGGNAWSFMEPDTGIEIHKYGTHLFHSSNKKVWDFVNLYSDFRGYRHTVFATVKGEIYQLPINLNTINSFFKMNLTPTEAEIFMASISPNLENPQNFEEKVISKIGIELYETFYKGYSQKQWGTDPKLLPVEMASRLPVRTTRNNRYFKDKYEGLPADGYFQLLENICNHPLIDVLLDTDFFKVKNEISKEKLLIYSGPIDKYFGNSRGALSWRTLDFTYETLDINDYQGVPVMNYPDFDIPFTRIHEYKHLQDENNWETSKTIISKEFSRFAENNDEPYYPINTPIDRTRLEAYRDLAKSETNTIFGGRLGTYKYLDMDMAIASAFVVFENRIVPRFVK